MPYEVRYKPKLPPIGRPWKLWNVDKKKYVSSSKTKEMAEKAARMRILGEHGVLRKHKKKGK
jgi:hypothetical protein